MSEPFAVNTLQRAGSKPTPQDWSIDEETLEGWCHRDKKTDEFLLDTSSVSQLSDDHWFDEAKPSVFKNALANLSEGLASMHRRDILNTASSNRRSATNKSKNFNIKSNSNITKVKANSQRSKKKENQEKDKENLTAVILQSEPNLLSEKVEETSEPKKLPVYLQDLEAKTSSQSAIPQEEDTKTPTDSNHNMSTSIKQELQDNKDLTEQSEDLKEVNNTENALRSAKASVYGSEIGSASQLEIDFDSEKVPVSVNKRYSVLIKKSKLPMSQRSVRQIQKDDLRVNKSLLQTKPIQSIQEALAVLDTNKPLKRDPVSVMPIPQNKTAISIKEMQFANLPLKIDGIATQPKVRDENHQALSFQKRPPEVLEIKTTTLRNVLGQAFKNAEAPPLFSLNLKGNAIGKQKENSKENIKESVEYILGLYKSGADKGLERSRTYENNYTRESFKVTENLKRTSYQPKVQPLKEKVMNQDDIFSRASLKSQSRPETTGFRIKKANSDIEDKKGFMLGTVKMNEVVFQ